MKTTLLSVAFLLMASLGSYAQSPSAENSIPSSLVKGSIQLGAQGSANFGLASFGNFKSFLVAPRAGYLVYDRLVTGLTLTYSHDKFTSKDTGRIPHQDQKSVSPEVFARYYLFSGKLKPFAEVGVGYNFLNADGLKENGAYLSPAIGLSYWVGKHFALEASYKFKLQREEMNRIDPASDLKFRLGVSVGISR